MFNHRVNRVTQSEAESKIYSWFNQKILFPYSVLLRSLCVSNVVGGAA